MMNEDVVDVAAIKSNPFFIFLQERCASILAAIIHNDWTLAVPLASSIPSEFLVDGRIVNLPEELIGNHICCCLNGQEYATLSNRTVLIREGHIYGQKGFDKGVSSKIVSDVLLQDSSTGSIPIVVYLIDKPIFTTLPEAAGSTFWNIIQSMGDTYTPILTHVDQAIGNFNDKVTYSNFTLDMVKAEMRQLLDQCHEILNAVEPKLIQPTQPKVSGSFEMLRESLESYVMEKTYELVYFRISKDFGDKDRLVAASTNQLEDIDLIQLGLPPELGFNLMTAVEEFENLAIRRTPYEKLKCLMRSIQILNSKSSVWAPDLSSSNLLLSSDVLVPLLVLMVIRSNIQNIYSSMYYIQHFSFENDVVSGEYGYALSSLEAVIEYVLSSMESLAQSCQWNRALQLAAKKGSLSEVEEYLNKSGEEKRHTLLHICVLKDYLDLAIFLLENGADASIGDFDSNTPFLWAVKENRVNFINLFAKHSSTNTNINLDHQNNRGLGALHYAKTNTIDELLKHIKNLDIKNNEGLTPLLYHCLRHETSIVEKLINAGANLLASDSGYRSCLHLCAFRGYTSLVSVILARFFMTVGSKGSRKLKVVLGNMRSTRGSTPLHVSSEAGNLEIVQMFVEAGFDIRQKNYLGQTAVDVAKDDKVREYLEAKMLFEGVEVPLGQMVAQIVRSIPVEGDFKFVIKSGPTTNAVEDGKKRIEYLNDLALDTYPPVVESFDHIEQVLKQADATLVSIGTNLKKAVASARKLSKSKKELAYAARAFRFSMGCPKGCVLSSGVEAERNLCEALRLYAGILSTQSNNEIQFLLDVLIEASCGHSGATLVFERWNIVTVDYAKVAREAHALSASVSRLETIAKTYGGEDRVKRLSEVYYQYSEVNKNKQQISSMLNYCEEQLKTELTHFHKSHGEDICKGLNEYVGRQLQSDREALDVLQSALETLDSFIP
ncbi:hypothetical protein HDV05_003861 [Chytridiales sp. JEL 0842]|nr:hypothetical protein HDV05_003861 [Chytridiales sp. JEL 0842]